MLTISGIGVIPKDSQVTERQNKFGSYFDIVLIGKDPYRIDKKHYFRVNVQVPLESVDAARDTLKQGTAIWIRIGELTGNKLNSGFIIMGITTKWRWVEVIKALPVRGAKRDS